MNMRESKPADVFSFGMLAMEIFTGQIPFVEQENATEVVFQILRGDRPKMPKNAREVGLTVEIWNLIESCWRQDPKRRPTIEEIVARLQELVNKTKDNVGVSKCVRIASLVPFLTTTQGNATRGGTGRSSWSATDFWGYLVPKDFDGCPTSKEV